MVAAAADVVTTAVKVVAMVEIEVRKSSTVSFVVGTRFLPLISIRIKFL